MSHLNHCNQLSDAELCVFYGNGHDAELCVFYGNGHAADGASISMSVQLLQGCKVSAHSMMFKKVYVFSVSSPWR